jgi:O-antigen biosynthesis protein
MRRVAVGIAVHAEPRRFAATLDAVRATAGDAAEILVVADHADAETEAALASLAPPATILFSEETGGAAGFNRLLGATDAAFCVLLESGCRPAPGWLDRLLDGLGADPRNGLAGPSTNRSWNEQAAEPACPESAAEIARAAQRLAARHGAATRTLEPLLSLSDFCYAVRREVWEAIGAADEGYGAGPCWEMDYNARAARAGWRGVWVPAAFVWRAPFTPRRARDERRLFAASRQRYQDRLCGLRLRGERTTYEPHCRGDACEHFAPAGLVRLRIEPPAAAPEPRRRADPLQAADPEASAPPISTPPGSAAAHPAPDPLRAGPPPAAPPRPPPPSRDAPLVSCIMPTRGRTGFALQAVRYFLAQDYPRRELIVLDDAGGDLGAHLPDDPRIRYEALPAGSPIGAKRNRGAELARGEVIAHWDDDDWYAPSRLREQVAPILANRADVTALRCEVFFDLERWEFWGCSDALHRRLFVQDVHGGTLVFRASLWRSRARYPSVSLAEDAAFLTRVVRGGARLRRVDTPGLFVYLRHGANAWRFACGSYLDPAGWRRIEEPPQLASERGFYLARTRHRPAAPAAPPPRPTGAAARPLVSCLMPTADRRRFVPRAVEHFLRQDYAARELVIVDDGVDPVEDLVPDDPRIRYLRAPRARSLGAKRNLACSLARGELIAHWDDDDWMADRRLTVQVEALLANPGAEVCGLDRLRFFDPAAERAWEYRWTDRQRRWVAGNTMLYRRSAWERRPFPEVDVGEDTRWIWATPSDAVTVLDDPALYAALVHPGNTSRKRTQESRWHPVPLDVVRREMGDDWAFYARRPAARPVRVPQPSPGGSS